MDLLTVVCSTAIIAGFRQTVSTAAMNVSLSVISTIGKISGIAGAYRSGDISVDTVKDYAVYRFREWCIRNLECGHVTSYPKFYDMVYYDGDRKYRIRFPKKLGLRQITRVTHNEKDVTNLIIEFLGPSRNFHGIPTSPDLLGWSSLKVKYRNGVERTYDSTDIISLDPPRE